MTTGDYMCFLVNAGRGAERTSNSVIVSPPIPSLSNLTAAAGMTRINLSWRLSPNHCGYQVYTNVSWNSTAGAGSDMISEMSYSIGFLHANTQYNITLQPYIKFQGKTYFGQKAEVMQSTNATNGTPPAVPADYIPSESIVPGGEENPGSGVNFGAIFGSIVGLYFAVGCVLAVVVLVLCLVKRTCYKPSSDQTTDHLLLLPEEDDDAFMDASEEMLHCTKLPFEVVHPPKPPPLDCKVTHAQSIPVGEKIVTSEEKKDETEQLKTPTPVEEETFCSNFTSPNLCHNQQVQPPADPFRTEFQVELPCSADAAFQDTLDEDSQFTSLPLMGCVTDETETLPFPVQVTTCTVPEEECSSLVTGVTAIWQESLNDQDMFVLPELTFGQLLSSMTADETDEDLVIPEQEVTSVMVVPSSKLLSKSVVLSSAPPPTPGPFRCSVYRDRLPPDDIHSNGDTRLGRVHTDVHELLKSEVKIPGNTLEVVDALSAPFRNKLADDTVTTLSLPCSDAPVSFPMCAFPICVEEEEELPDLRSATPSDHHVTENLDVTDSISVDEPSEAHDPPESVNTNPQHSPPMPPHSTGDLGYQHVSRTDRWPRGGGSGKYSKKQELLIVDPWHVVLCSPLVCTEGGNFSTAA